MNSDRRIDTALADLPPEEAEETLRAIMRGEVDAFVVEGADGAAVYTLRDANHPYRIIIERMSEGAAVVDEDGLLLYSNHRFAEFTGMDKGGLLGRPIRDFVAPAHVGRVNSLLALARSAPAATEVDLAGGAATLPVSLSATPIEIEAWQSCVALIVTDLSLRQRSRKIAAAEEFARSILDQTAEPMIVCDPAGVVTHASLAAQALCACHPLGRPLTEAFPVTQAETLLSGAASVHGLEVEMACRDGQPRSFLAGASPLRAARGRVMGRIITLSDITARKRSEQALRAAKAEAERATQAKSHFLAAASHDLRQPFQALRLLIDILNQQLTEPGHLKVAAAASQALGAGESLLHALLDVSNFDAGTVAIHREVFALSEIMVSLASDCDGLCRQKGLELVVVPSSVMVDSDPVLLSRLLRNLLHNAIKYTERGRILFGCRRVGRDARIEIWDTGVGIAPEQLHRIFDDFYQVGNASRDQANGLGIGLSVVQRTASLLGHQVTVRSTPGRGSVFAVTVAAAAD